MFSTPEKVEVTDVQVPRKKRARQIDGSEEDDEAMPAVKEEP